MRKLTPVRRTIAAVLTATFVGAVAVTATALPSSAAPGHGGHHDHNDFGVSEHLQDNQQVVPAPPAPPRKVPVERVVATGQTPAKTRTGVKEQIKNALSGALSNA